METPPLTRGRRSRGLHQHAHDGNTPAYAGKTSFSSAFWTIGWKHPRLRGEDAVTTRPAGANAETPPLTRGRHRLLLAAFLGYGNTPAYAGKTKTILTVHDEIRNTPAYAGKTYYRQCWRCSLWKHPRLRGEDLHLSGQGRR